MSLSEEQAREMVDRAIAIAAAIKEAVAPLVVDITHEPFIPWFTLTYNGQTEDLDHVECLAWFKARGARDMDAVNEEINTAFNFHRARVIIARPIAPPPKIPGSDQYLPQI